MFFGGYTNANKTVQSLTIYIYGSSASRGAICNLFLAFFEMLANFTEREGFPSPCDTGEKHISPLFHSCKNPFLFVRKIHQMEA